MNNLAVLSTSNVTGIHIPPPALAFILGPQQRVIELGDALDPQLLVGSTTRPDEYRYPDVRPRPALTPFNRPYPHMDSGCHEA